MEVIVYTKNVCPWCARLKAFITAHGGTIIERNVDTSVTAFEEWSKLGVLGVPVAVINGKTLIGFTAETQEALQQLLNGDGSIED